MKRLIRILFAELGDVLLFLAFARPKTMHGELRYHRQQLQRRRLKITDTEREELLAQVDREDKPG